MGKKNKQKLVVKAFGALVNEKRVGIAMLPAHSSSLVNPFAVHQVMIVK